MLNDGTQEVIASCSGKLIMDLYIQSVVERDGEDLAQLFEDFWPYLIDDGAGSWLLRSAVVDQSVRQTVQRMRNKALTQLLHRLRELRFEPKDVQLDCLFDESFVDNSEDTDRYLTESQRATLKLSESIIPFVERNCTRRTESSGGRVDVLIRERNRISHEDLLRDEANFQRLSDEQQKFVRDVALFVHQQYSIQNEQQQSLSDEPLFYHNAYDNQQPMNGIRLRGDAGTGKTITLKVLLAVLRLRGHIVLPMSFMASSASLLPGGDTVHRTCKVGLKTDRPESALSKLTGNHTCGKLLKAASLIIIDEVSMLHTNYIAAIDTLLRDLMGNQLSPFGGKVILSVGDFKQIAPVVKGDRYETIKASPAIDVDRWQYLAAHTYQFSKNFRASEDPAFSHFLWKLGHGIRDAEQCQRHTIDDPESGSCHVDWSSGEGCCTGPKGNFTNQLQCCDGLFQIGLPSDVLCTSNVDEAYRHLYPDSEIFDDPRRLGKRQIIAFRNTVVDQHNADVKKEILRHYPTREVMTSEASYSFPSRNDDAGDDAGRERNYDVEGDDEERQRNFIVGGVVLSQRGLRNENPSGMPPHSLELFHGANVSLMRNVDPSQGLFNTAKFYVDIHRSNPYVLALVKLDDEQQTVHYVRRISFPGETLGGSVKYTRHQFPVRLSYACTSNRVQGYTFETLDPDDGNFNLLIDARDDPFAHGQMYAGLSRARNVGQLVILLPEEVMQSAARFVKSVIYRPILSNAGDEFPRHLLGGAVQSTAPIDDREQDFLRPDEEEEREGQIIDIDPYSYGDQFDCVL